MAFFERFAAVRLAAIVFRLAHLMIAEGFLPPDAPMLTNNPALRILADLLGTGHLSGEMQSFVGNR